MAGRLRPIDAGSKKDARGTRRRGMCANAPLNGGRGTGRRGKRRLKRADKTRVSHDVSNDVSNDARCSGQPWLGWGAARVLVGTARAARGCCWFRQEQAANPVASLRRIVGHVEFERLFVIPDSAASAPVAMCLKKQPISKEPFQGAAPRSRFKEAAPAKSKKPPSFSNL